MLQSKNKSSLKQSIKNNPILFEESNTPLKPKNKFKNKKKNSEDSQQKQSEEIKYSPIDSFEKYADTYSKQLNEPIINQKNYLQALESEKKKIDKSIDKISIKLYQYHMLKETIHQCASYPEKTRKYIWQFLLSLPHDTQLYSKYSSQGIHPFFQFINEMYPLKDKAYEEPLKVVCSLLAYWSPNIGNVYFLPSIVYPFVKSFPNDYHFVFEALIAIITSMCQYWFEYYPGAPLFHLKLVEKMIQREDNELYSHILSLQEISGNCELKMIDIIWRYLKTFFSENLVKDHWLQLFDFLLTHNHKPEIFLYFTAAYLIKIKQYVLKANDTQRLIDILFDINPNISLGKVFKETLGLYKKYSKYQLYKYRPHIPFGSNAYPSFIKFPLEYTQTTSMVKEAIFKTANDYKSKEREIKEIEAKFRAELKKEEEVQRKYLSQINAENEQEEIIRKDLDIILFHKTKYNDELTKDQIDKLSSLNGVIDKSIKIYDTMNDTILKKTEKELALKHEYEDIILNQKKMNYEYNKYDTNADRCLVQLLNMRNKTQSNINVNDYADYRSKERLNEKEINEDKWRIEDEEKMKKLAQMRATKELELQYEHQNNNQEIRKCLDQLSNYEQSLLIQQIEKERQDRNMLINRTILKDNIEQNTKTQSFIPSVNPNTIKFSNQLIEQERLKKNNVDLIK